MKLTAPPTPPPIFPVQGWNWRLTHGSLSVALPIKDGYRYCLWSLEVDAYYQQLQRWLQFSRFWYYVIGQPLVDHRDYDAVVEAADRLHREFPEENPLPLYWWWNHLPCRYDDWCRRLFVTIPLEARRPRYPWLYGEFIYPRPLDLSVQSGIMESQKPTLSEQLSKASFQFE